MSDRSQLQEQVQETALSREEQKAEPLFAGRVEVYAKAVSGPVRRFKWAMLLVLLGIYYFTPWIRWDRGPGAPDQAVLIDMPSRRAYFFWLEIWPQEVYYLTGLLILAALGLFLATSLFGRVWCGFACPQTVWTDLYMMVERWIEGDRNKRIKFDKAPWTGSKIARRSLKHLIWLFIALMTGGAWIMYFENAPTFVVEFFTGQAGTGAYFFVGLFTATTYLLAGFAREQVCTYMCPWPRIQAALVDEDSMVVTYEKWRGEPRGKHKKGESWDERGDCIDCRQCVAVCPTGIDIRDGMQLECIGCGLCIDACNEIMAKVDRPKNLINWDSERNQQLAAKGEPRHLRLIRPRTIAYVVILSLIVAGMFASYGTRATAEVNVLRDRNPLFVTLSDGEIRNGFTLKFLNKERADHEFTLTLDGLPPSARMTVQGTKFENATAATLPANPDGVTSYRVFVTVPGDDLDDEALDFSFWAETDDGQGVTHNSVFRGPEK